MKTNLLEIPGVGERMARRLLGLGYDSVESLRGADPEELYLRDCAASGAPVDRCVLYVYRAAVYYAETETPDPAKLLWWNWKG